MARAKANLQRGSHSRIFTIEDRAGPANVPDYADLGRAQAVSWDQGGSTPVRIPDPERYGAFVIVDRIKGQQGLPQLTIQFRMERGRSEVLSLVRKGCELDLQVHIGACQNPSDFDEGWEKILVLEGALADSYGTDDLGAFDADQDVVINETVPFTGRDFYEILQLNVAELAASQVFREVMDVVICDSKACGECGLSSDGCQRVFAVTLSAAGSPGVPAQLLYSADQGATWSDSNITTLSASEDPDSMACVGTNLVVVSQDADSIHYASIADIFNNVEVWTEITAGFEGAGAPRAIYSAGRTFTWIVGTSGFIYFSADITAGFTVQNNSATIQTLNDIDGIDDQNLVAVGASNAVVYTNNGGSTWSSVVGPRPGVILNAVAMHSEDVWFVGTADGRMYFTRDAGATWTQKRFTGDQAGQVRDITFATPTVGYMSHDTATPAGRIFRTINGGQTWYALPEGPANLTANDRINSLAACAEDPNLVFGGGLSDTSIDGVLLKLA